MGNVFLKALAPLALLTACATTGRPAPPERMGENRPRGRTLYEKSCARCHALYMPVSFSAPEWRFYVKKYGRKARLTSSQKATVFDYLSRNARSDLRTVRTARKLVETGSQKQ